MVSSKEEARKLIRASPNWNGGVDYDLDLQFSEETGTDYIFSAFYKSVFGRTKVFVQLCVNKETGQIVNLVD